MVVKGKTYWITGLSGAGKTTIGNTLFYKMKETNPAVLILDGDILKKFTDGDKPDYSFDGRLKRAKRYGQICKTLSDQGLTVIICTIAMYDEVREWNRKYIDGYVEVFLDVSVDILNQRNKKNLYKKNTDKPNMVAGLDIEVQLPKNPDIVINNNGELSVDECVDIILSYTPKYKNYDRDRNYWNVYYKDGGEIAAPSLFAKEVIKEVSSGMSLLELGCGDGRDSVFFASQGLFVTAVDQSDVAIKRLSDELGKFRNLRIICDDFIKSNTLYQEQYDVIYSRFTLHAINEDQENILLPLVWSSLKVGGQLFIEARTINDAIYGRGEKVEGEETAYIFEGHYRRFIDPQKLIIKLEKMNFTIVKCEESDDFSPTEHSRPVLVRLQVVKGFA